MHIERIMQAKTLFELLEAVDEFCRNALLRDNDDDCMELKRRAEESENDFIRILAAYLSACEDGEEIISALYEFASNCRGFAEADETETEPVTKAEFEAVLDECEEKCGLKSCLKRNHTLCLAEVDAVCEQEEFSLRVWENRIGLFLPRIEKGRDHREYLAGQLGVILYDVVKTKITEESLRQEIRRFIPETRESHTPTKQLFRQYFYSVLLYEKRKLDVYPHFDEHMRQTIILECFQRIIRLYLRE